MKMDYHIHSNFSDGDNTPEEIVKAAIKLGYTAICIIDHVRRDTAWVSKFIKEMGSLQERYQRKIELFSAIEAKVLDLNGNIDMLEEWAGKVDLVYAAFHQILDEKGGMSSEQVVACPAKAINLWRDAMLKVLDNSLVDIIAHPGALLKQYRVHIPYDHMEAIAAKAKINDKIFEINAKYHVPENDFLQVLNSLNVKLSYGSDSHSISELSAYLGESNIFSDKIVTVRELRERKACHGKKNFDEQSG